MKLAFPNGEHDGVTLGKGSVSIGTSDKDEIRITLADEQQVSISLILDQRGITLAIAHRGEAVDVTVNARAVSEKAILRLGDSISLAGVTMVLQGHIDTDSAAEQSATVLAEGDEMPAKYHLRGVSGGGAGSLVPIRGRITLGAQAGAGAKRGPKQSGYAAIEQRADGIHLECLAAGSGLAINGQLRRKARLTAGDQIDCEGERFVLETPDFVPGRAYAGLGRTSGTSNTQVFAAPVFEASDAQSEPPAAGGGKSITRRDYIIIGVCVALSAAMLIWLFATPF